MTTIAENCCQWLDERGYRGVDWVPHGAKVREVGAPGAPWTPRLPPARHRLPLRLIRRSPHAQAQTARPAPVCRAALTRSDQS